MIARPERLGFPMVRPRSIIPWVRPILVDFLCVSDFGLFFYVKGKVGNES